MYTNYIENDPNIFLSYAMYLYQITTEFEFQTDKLKDICIFYESKET